MSVWLFSAYSCLENCPTWRTVVSVAFWYSTTGGCWKFVLGSITKNRQVCWKFRLLSNLILIWILFYFYFYHTLCVSQWWLTNYSILYSDCYTNRLSFSDYRITMTWFSAYPLGRTHHPQGTDKSQVVKRIHLYYSHKHLAISRNSKSHLISSHSIFLY